MTDLTVIALAAAATAIGALLILMACERWRRRIPDPNDEAGA